MRGAAYAKEEHTGYPSYDVRVPQTGQAEQQEGGQLLSLEGLRRQIEAAFHDEEISTWPVLVQREISPDYTGWSTSGQVGRQDLTGGKPSAPRELIKLLSSIGLTGLASWWRW